MMKKIAAASSETTNKSHILFVGSAFPPSAGGSSIVMSRLLENLNSLSYSIVTLTECSYIMKDSNYMIPTCGILRLHTLISRPYRLSVWCRLLTLPYYLIRSIRFAKKEGATKVVAVYPTLDFLALGMILARILHLPFYPYLHDTVAEGNEKNSLTWVAKFIQREVFLSSRKVLVMSSGMSDLMKRKYSIEAIPIRHINSLERKYLKPSQKFKCHGLFFGGAMYTINDAAVKRVAKAAKLIGELLECSGIRSPIIDQYGSVLVSPMRYKTSSEYLSAIETKSILILALNKPFESNVGADELATIFPTKTPEYLLSGRPILVHCPKEYFLARFFHDNDCGMVVESDKIEDIALAMQQLLSREELAKKFVYNAYKTARQFNAESVASDFINAIA